MDEKGRDERMTEDFASMFEASEAAAGERTRVEVGQTVVGRVIAIGQTTAFVEVGDKSEALLDLAELRDPESGEVTLAEGDRIEATVVDDGSTSGTIVLRRSLGRGGHLPAELEQAYAAGVPVEGVVRSENKGGFEVQLGAARAFCPRSQIDRRRGELVAADYIGKRFAFRITKLDTDRRDIVVSRRAILDAEAEARAQETREKIVPGAVLEGVVTNLQPFGAFVDLGGIEGMVHVSELAYGRVGHPSEVLEPGQRVTVKVVQGGEGEGGKPRVGLSLKDLADDPWASVERDFPVGSTVRGRVRRLESYGAFVELAPGLEGLAHISKLTLDRRLAHARQALEDDQEGEATAHANETGPRRLSLSLVEKARGARVAADAREQEEQRQALEQQNRPRSLGSFADLLPDSGDEK